MSTISGSASMATRGLRSSSSMQTIMDLVKPKPDAKWVVFYSLGDGPGAGVYYDATRSSK
jgi:DMSO/TMAO reductase YedYZ molybdopterin-dependent catalytic subunit